MSTFNRELNIDSLDCSQRETLKILEWQILCEHLAEFASTEQGKIYCKTLIPTQKLSYANKLLEETIEIGKLDKQIEGGISFRGVSDIDKIITFCQKGGIISGEELLKVANNLAAMRRLKQLIDDSENRPVISKLFTNLFTLTELEKEIKTNIEDGGRVADRASEKLTKFRQDLLKLKNIQRDLLQKAMKTFVSILQDNTISERNGRQVLSIKAFAVNQISGTIHGNSASGNTIFVEPKIIISIGNQIIAVEGLIYIEEQRLLSIWSKKVGGYYKEIKYISDVLLILDAALARARYGDFLGGTPPRIVDDINSSFSFIDLCHPILIWQEKREGKSSVIPISVEVNSLLKVVLITGPNTGGKTVALKSIGLVVLMAQAGLLLPCKGIPCLPWCEKVLADIGDEQSLKNNLSTFSGHIKRLKGIFNSISESDGNTLVLLDEVGAGTDPSEGTALAISLLKVLAERSRLTIATTHFGELKSLKYNDSRFENASVSFDSETIRPTYYLQWGIPGKSNALEIASRLGLDEIVLKNAYKLLTPKGTSEVNKIICALEEQRQRQQIAAESAAVLLAKTEILHDELLESWEFQKKYSDVIKENNRIKLLQSIQEGQQEVRDLIKKLRSNNANGETARLVGGDLRKMEIDLLPQPLKTPTLGWNPSVGDRVRLLALGKSGEVVEISQDGLTLTVLCGLFRSKVDLDSVESLDGTKPNILNKNIKVEAPIKLKNSLLVRTEKNTVDVRGLRVHEAESVVDEFLRRTNGPIWVIHGVGSGKLKRGLRDWLVGLPYVERVIDAEKDEGGQGTTIIWPVG